MRIFAILSLFIVVSCASPLKDPENHYAGTYAPSKLNIEENSFLARATVVEKKNEDFAQKAAYLRLMKGAKAKGYRYFKVTSSAKSRLFGTSYTIKGKLYKSSQTGAGIFLLDDISRVLQGLPIKRPYVAPKPIRKKKKTALRKAVRKVIPKPVAAPVIEQIAEPVIEAVDELTDEPAIGETDGPTVIMAPEDITGTIVKRKIPSNITGVVNSKSNSLNLSNAVSDIPAGVVIRKK